MKYFDAILETLNELDMSKFGIRATQVNHGNKMIIYQGSLSNIWGQIEAIFDGEVLTNHYTKIYSSTLRNLVREKFQNEEHRLNKFIDCIQIDKL